MSVNDKYSLETHLAEIYHKFPDGGLLKERYADKEIRLEKGMHALMTSGTERLEKLINEIRNFIYTESLSISQRYTGALGVGVCEDKSLKLRAYAGKKCSCFPAGRIYSVFAERYTGAETMAKILIFLVSSCSVCAFVPYSGEPLCVYEYIYEKVKRLFRKSCV